LNFHERGEVVNFGLAWREFGEDAAEPGRV
jgi:hypothetical protein